MLRRTAVVLPALLALPAVIFTPGVLASHQPDPGAARVAAADTSGSRERAPRWWVGFQFGLANPTSDLGKVNDSGPLFLATVGRKLEHPFSVRASAAFIPLQRGGFPQGPPWNGERRGPLTDLLILVAGPSLDLTPEGLDAVDVSWTLCGGITRWDATGTDVTAPFTDTDLTGCIFMEAVMNLNRRWAVNAHFDAFMIRGSGSDSNPFVKEVVQGLALGVRYRF